MPPCTDETGSLAALARKALTHKGLPMPTEFVEAFTGCPSRELVEFTLCGLVAATLVLTSVVCYIKYGD